MYKKQTNREKKIYNAWVNKYLEKNRKTQVVHEHISQRIEGKELYFIPKSKIYKIVLFGFV